MARIKKYAETLNQNLTTFNTFIVDTNPNSTYFRISEFKEAFTGGKNGFLIEGSEHLMETTEIKMQILDVDNHSVYFEPGNGVPEYYEGLSKVVAVHIYEDTPIGEGKITILGELKTYIDDNGIVRDIPDEWKGVYNVKWEKSFKINRLLSNEDKVRFYKRPNVNIDEIVKPLFSTGTTTILQSGSVSGDPVTPPAGQPLTNYTLPTFYKLTINDNTNWTGSVVGTYLNFNDLNYTPLVNNIINNKEILVSTPYTEGGVVASFDNQAYTASFNYLEGISNLATALTGSFAKINLTDLTTFVGDVARVEVYRKSESQIGDYQLIQTIVLEANEILKDVTTTTKNEEFYGIFTSDIIKNYWVTSSNSLLATWNQNYLYDSVKLNSSTNVGYFHTSQSFAITENAEYNLTFNARLGQTTSTSDYIRAFISGSTTKTYNGVTVTTGIEQTIKTINAASSSLLQKTEISANIKAQNISNAKLYFEVKGSNWYIADVSLKASQESAFSPDEVTFIESVPRSLPVETFDYRFKFYDINSNYVPVTVESRKTFNGGNLQTIRKGLVFNPRSLAFQFDSGSNPVPPTVLGFTVTKTLLTGSVHYTSRSFDFDGNELVYDDYTASFTGKKYPGRLDNIESDAPTMTVGNFTGSRSDKTVQLVSITGECEGYTDTVIFTRVLDGFGGVNHLIRPFRGTQIRNSSTSSLEIQAIRIDGVNDIQLNSTARPERGWNLIQLHVLSGSAPYEKFINLNAAKTKGYVQGLSVGELGSKEINFNAIFNRDSIDKRRTVYLMSSASAASNWASITSASVLASINLEDLQDGLDTPIVGYNADTFTINFRTDDTFRPLSGSATASFYLRGTNKNPISASVEVYPSMSINKDFVPEYWMYYVTTSVDPNIAVIAVDEKKNIIQSKPIGSYVGLTNKQSKILTVTFTYTEPYTNTQISADKTFTIVPEGKPGDESIVFELNPANLTLNANAKGIIGTYTPANTELKLKQGASYLVFTGSKNPGTFWINNISQSAIQSGSISYAVDQYPTSSLLMTSMSNMTQLSASLTYDLLIHPYYTSSRYTQSINQNFTKAVDGAPPLELILTPTNTTVNADENGFVKLYSPTNTTVRVREGNDYLTFTTTSIAPGTFRFIAVSGSNIRTGSNTGYNTTTASLLFNNFNPPYTSASVDYQILTYPFSLFPGHTTGSKVLTTKQNITKINDAVKARSVTITADSQVVNFDNNGVVVSPIGDITLTATPFNTTGSAYYQWFKDGNAYTDIATYNDVYYVTSDEATSPGETAVWAVELRDGSATDIVRARAEITISGTKSGTNAYSVVLTNEACNLTYKVSGQLVFSGTAAQIKANKGENSLTHVNAFSTQTQNIKYEDIGSLGEYQVKIYAKSAHITLAGGLAPGDVVPTVSGVATIGEITAWSNPETYATAQIIYEINCEQLATFYKTESISLSYEGRVGPGVVFRGPWLNTIDYIGQVETTNYRRDAVSYNPYSSTLRYYASISGSGPATYNGAGTLVNYHAPTGLTTDNDWWQYLGEEEFFVAAKLAIFEKSIVKETLNIGTKDTTGAFSNIVLAGGRNDPYMAMGQSGTEGLSGDQVSSGVIGYSKPGIFLGIYENPVPNGTTGRFSIRNSGTSSTRGLFWDGDQLTIIGSIRQVTPGVNEGSIRGDWASGITYYQYDYVVYAGQTWKCTSSTYHVSTNDTNSSTGKPGSGPWSVAAAAGTSGLNGTSGTTGPAGSDGPGVVFRGEWSSLSVVYTGTTTRRDVVRYSPNSTNPYWLANIGYTHTSDSSNHPPAAGSSANTWWQPFGATFTSVATDVLLAQDATITRGLVLGEEGSYNGFLRSANADSLLSGTGFFLDVNGRFRFGQPVLAGNNYVYWDGTNLNISGILNATQGNIGGFTISNSQLIASGSLLRINTSIPEIDFYLNATGSAKVAINANSQLTYAGSSTIYVSGSTYDGTDGYRTSVSGTSTGTTYVTTAYNGGFGTTTSDAYSGTITTLSAGTTILTTYVPQTSLTLSGTNPAATSAYPNRDPSGPYDYYSSTSAGGRNGTATWYVQVYDSTGTTLITEAALPGKTTYRYAAYSYQYYLADYSGLYWGPRQTYSVAAGYNGDIPSGTTSVSVSIPTTAVYQLRLTLKIIAGSGYVYDNTNSTYTYYANTSTTYHTQTGDVSPYSFTLSPSLNKTEINGGGIQVIINDKSYIKMQRFEPGDYSSPPLLYIYGGSATIQPGGVDLAAQWGATAVSAWGGGYFIGKLQVGSGGTTISPTAYEVLKVDGAYTSTLANQWYSTFTSNILPYADDTFDLGKASSGRWRDIFTNGAVTTTSDRTKKTNITPSTLGLDFINKLNPVSYTMITGSKVWEELPKTITITEEEAEYDGEYLIKPPKYKEIPNPQTPEIIEILPGKRKHYGLIAQDVKVVLDEMGISTNDFAGYMAADPIEHTDLGLRYEEFISPMIKAIQELSAKVDRLENEISSSKI